MKRSQRILDPIHGLIRFDRDNATDRLAWRLLDQPIFGRLRRIKQLGFAEFVFPGATHSRFSHSIGVFHMARRLTHMVARQLGARFDSDKAAAAQLAALLHDIGHGPFSHSFEKSEQRCGSKKSHEAWSVDIIKNDPALAQPLEESGLLAEVIAMVDTKNEKGFYHAIVSSQFDADRLDYLQRDRYMSGIGAGGFDCDWLLECLEVSPELGFYLNHKSQYNVEEYLLARYHLYLHVYTHKTVRAAEMMLSDILFQVAEDPEASGLASDHPLRLYYGARTHDHYLALDDIILWQAITVIAAHARDEKLRKIAAALYHRQFYKCFDVGLLAETAPDGAARLEVFLEKLRDQHVSYLIDRVQISPYGDQQNESKRIKISTQAGIDDISQISPLIRALPEKNLCRVYAADSEHILRAQELWAQL